MSDDLSRPVSDVGQDDLVLPFVVEPLESRGRIVRLGASVDGILSRHAYPAPVARLVGEAVAMTALLGSALKFDGRFQLQTRTDGAVSMIVVDYDAPDRMRAFARFDEEALAIASRTGESAPAQLLGRGHLALTIDQGPDMSRYQGVVPLDGQGLEQAAHQYFLQSEQIPTQVRLAVAESHTGEGRQWRAGGLMVQFLPQSEDRLRQRDLHPGDAPVGTAMHDPGDDDAWAEAKSLAATVEDHELVDPTLSSERLLYRLFHERGVKVFEGQNMREACRCSTERIADMLRGFSPQERHDMVGDNGRIGVTCEFCSAHRDFNPADFEQT